MLKSDFTVECPCCDTRIRIDHKTGAVVSHQPPVHGGGAKSFEEAFRNDEVRKTQAEDRFDQAIREHENREELLDKKFKEAFAKAEKDDSPPPPRPFELD